MEGLLPPTSDNTVSHRELFGLIPFLIFVFVVFLRISFIFWKIGQKTRDPQPRRVYVGSRGRPSIGHQPPTVYVSPSNLPPPPKYEAMEPPSYEEVVGIHYPQYQPPVHSPNQPITLPITNAVATHSTQIVISVPEATGSATTNTTVTTNAGTADRRTSVTVASSV